MNGYGLVSQKTIDGKTYTAWRNNDNPKDEVVEIDGKINSSPDSTVLKNKTKISKLDKETKKVSLKEYWNGLQNQSRNL
jgi:hypothetical protein